MHRVPAIRIKEMALDPPLSATMQNVAGQLAPSSRKTYTSDAKHFAQWMAEHHLSLSWLGRDDVVAIEPILREPMPSPRPHACGLSPDDSWMKRSSAVFS